VATAPREAARFARLSEMETGNERAGWSGYWR